MNEEFENSNNWYSSQPEPQPESQPEPQGKKQKQGMSGGKVVAIALCCSLLAGAAGGAGVYFGTGLNKTPVSAADVSYPEEAPASEEVTVSTLLQGERDKVNVEYTTVNTSGAMTAAEVYEANVGSTVGITTSVTVTNLWGYQSTAPASGSGFIVSADGYVVTNYHVIEGGSDIKVTDKDGNSYDASVVGYDEKNDLAVLKVEAENLKPVVLGDSDDLRVGETVVAIGNPLGELTFSMTGGIVSALDREVTTSSGVTMNLIQTDCAINSGNSGGALFNLYGEVIGITNAKYSGSSGSGASIDNIGFAIPITSVRSIIESIIENGCLVKPYIGVTIQTVSEEAQSFGIPAGVAIAAVAEDGPASKAGLQEKDIITAVDGNEVTVNSDIVNYVSRCKGGDVIVLTVYRSGEILEISVTVGEQVQNAFETQQPQQQVQQLPGFGG